MNSDNFKLIHGPLPCFECGACRRVLIEKPAYFAPPEMLLCVPCVEGEKPTTSAHAATTDIRQLVGM